jgi:hypothetical protein
LEFKNISNVVYYKIQLINEKLATYHLLYFEIMMTFYSRIENLNFYLRLSIVALQIHVVLLHKWTKAHNHSFMASWGFLDWNWQFGNHHLLAAPTCWNAIVPL